MKGKDIRFDGFLMRLGVIGHIVNGRKTATEIAKEENVTSQAITKKLRIMLKEGLLKSGERTQRQEYELNIEKIIELMNRHKKEINSFSNSINVLEGKIHL